MMMNRAGLGGRTGERRRTAARQWLAGVFGSFPAALMAASEPMGFAAVDTADITATCLLVAGIVFLLLELKIVSFGILGLLGTACMTLSCVVIWMEGDGTFWGIALTYYIPIIVLILASLLALGFLATQAYKQQVTSGSEGFIGELAQASEALEPQGRVFFQGTYWQAVSQVPVPAGSVVRVTGVDRLTLFVEPVVEGE